MEHQFANNLTLSAGYVGQDASHLVISDRFWSQPVLGTAPLQQRRRIYPVMPLVTEVVVTNPVGKQNYQGLQVSVRKRLSTGLGVQFLLYLEPCSLGQRRFLWTDSGEPAQHDAGLR